MMYCIAGFSRRKLFTNWPCPDFLEENFHESSIALSTYYIILMPANAIIVFNNYILRLPLWWNLSKWSPLWEDTIFTRMYGLLQLNNAILSLSTRRVPSLRGKSGQLRILVQCQTVENTPYFVVSLAIPDFSFAENFSYVPWATVPFCIMIYTTGFISSLIASVCEDNMVCVKDLLELAIGKTASLLPRPSSSFTGMSTLKNLNSPNLLLPKVNISRKNILWIVKFVKLFACTIQYQSSKQG